jgi:hypothetical protein
VTTGLQGGQKALLLSGHWKSAIGDTHRGGDEFYADSKIVVIIQLKYIDLMA